MHRQFVRPRVRGRAEVRAGVASDSQPAEPKVFYLLWNAFWPGHSKLDSPCIPTWAQCLAHHSSGDRLNDELPFFTLNLVPPAAGTVLHLFLCSPGKCAQGTPPAKLPPPPPASKSILSRTKCSHRPSHDSWVLSS
ncbi:PREDICTED: uncharacterized protein LOC101371207 [Odobenus rosmarus divergens]|uniref:Uncharacterized protein LOC101371207 n=1 Tax=Odobenus rosmarus divergens TaxID=9708 RepID=A0A9B0GNV9_ODORO